MRLLKGAKHSALPSAAPDQAFPDEKTSFRHPARTLSSVLSAEPSMETVLCMVYRLASYLALNLGEDAALLAFIFC